MKKDVRPSLSNMGNGKICISPIPVYVSAFIVSLCTLLCFFLYTNGDLISKYFFHDSRDTGMDFFHSIEYLRGKSPYDIFNTLYPPLANLFFLMLYYLVPSKVSSSWTYDFHASIAMRGTDRDLRTYQAPMLLFIVFVLVASWMLISLCVFCLKQQPARRANMVAFCMILGPGMLMAFERGNIIVIVVSLILYFIKYRNSDKRIVKESAFIALAVAAGLKLYPAFFGVLLLRDKKFKEAIRTIIYGLLSVVIPVLFFEEGITGISMWLSTVFRFGSGSKQPWIGTGFANILHRVARYFKAFLGIAIDTSWFSAAAILVTAILLLTSVLCRKEWQSVLTIVMAVIMYQSQGSYIFSIMCLPMLLFLAQEQTLHKKNIIPFLLMLLLSVHVPLFRSGNSNPSVAFKQLISLSLVCWCFFNGVNMFVQKEVNDNEKLE